MFSFRADALRWIRQPRQSEIGNERIVIVTDPHTDLWQRTYYGFQNDNAPVLYLETAEPFFSFVVKTQFASKTRFDQCGVAIYQDSENWLKASIEYENSRLQRLGSVVTNLGYSDWATTDLPGDVNTMWYRLSRRQSDYCIECSQNGSDYSQLRIAHLHHGDDTIRFGLYACSPGDSSFAAVFTDMQITDCLWESHS